MAQLVYLGKDAITSLTKTSFPTGTPDFDESDIIEVFILSGTTATATTAQVVDPYNATDWADNTKPSASHHIMFNVATRQWKAKDALSNGDLLVALVNPRGTRVKP